jgi:DNA processing protein
MITAELAHNYNRDVFAFPGKTTDSKSAGCNFLIVHKRAALLTSANDFIKAMRWEPRKIKPKAQQELFIDLSKEEKLIVQLLSAKETVHIDEIFLSSGLTSSAVAGAMLSLELQNIVSSLPGKLYKLC